MGGNLNRMPWFTRDLPRRSVARLEGLSVFRVEGTGHRESRNLPTETGRRILYTDDWARGVWSASCVRRPWGWKGRLPRGSLGGHWRLGVEVFLQQSRTAKSSLRTRKGVVGVTVGASVEPRARLIRVAWFRRRPGLGQHRSRPKWVRSLPPLQVTTTHAGEKHFRVKWDFFRFLCHDRLVLLRPRVRIGWLCSPRQSRPGLDAKVRI
jgi:hypothetical protein